MLTSECMLLLFLLAQGQENGAIKVPEFVWSEGPSGVNIGITKFPTTEIMSGLLVCGGVGDLTNTAAQGVTIKERWKVTKMNETSVKVRSGM